MEVYTSVNKIVINNAHNFFRCVAKVQACSFPLHCYCMQVVSLCCFYFIYKSAYVLLLMIHIDQGLPMNVVFSNSNVFGPPSKVLVFSIPRLFNCSFECTKRVIENNIANYRKPICNIKPPCTISPLLNDFNFS
ncbi:unnamed protein product [Moneuplotes crassus]|uniref:Uncharacterized protein n=1 Tax=Euplotes crassus TaxID=5936 RepID=A0AAD1UA71_EUPCR|nr:unnamed protein product [Moneuplotes crassus]